EPARRIGHVDLLVLRSLRSVAGEPGGDVAQIAERLVRDAVLIEIPREPIAREDTRRRPRGAAVGVAVADVDDAPRREGGALAPFTALRAHDAVARTDAPPVRAGVEAVGEQL